MKYKSAEQKGNIKATKHYKGSENKLPLHKEQRAWRGTVEFPGVCCEPNVFAAILFSLLFRYSLFTN